jgi:mono/diheme cytochrome c family protein
MVRSDRRPVCRVRLVGLVVVVALVGAGGRACAQGDDALVQRGQALFVQHGCYGCHTVGKTGTPIASDLTVIGRRRPAPDLLRWLAGPADEPRRHMPKIEMSPEEAHALAAYLASLR